MAKPRVLFVCDSNSTRSILAEALLRHHAPERFDIHSAGFAPRVVHSMTIMALRSKGVSVSGLTSKNITEYIGSPPFDHAFLLTQETPAVPSAFSGVASSWQFWQVGDPAIFAGNYPSTLYAFARVADEIEICVHKWLAEIPLRGEEVAKWPAMVGELRDEVTK